MTSIHNRTEIDGHPLFGLLLDRVGREVHATYAVDLPMDKPRQRIEIAYDWPDCHSRADVMRAIGWAYIAIARQMDAERRVELPAADDGEVVNA